jgi:disease resistance protein RPM1
LEAQDESVLQLADLKQLRSLRILNVKGIHCERLCEFLVEMPFLSYLHVGASDENDVLMLNALPPNLKKLRLNGRLAEGTAGEFPLFQLVNQNLYELRLYWSQLSEDPLPSLSRLANLTVLQFTRAYNGEKLVFLTGWFSKLKVLYLGDLPNLKQLEIKQGTMATLQTLTLYNLSSMVEVPPGIEFLMPLQSLVFGEITGDFLTLLCQCPGIDSMRWQYSLRD